MMGSVNVQKISLPVRLGLGSVLVYFWFIFVPVCVHLCLDHQNTKATEAQAGTNS